MVRLRVAELMKARRISAYALAKGAGLNYATAYRLRQLPSGLIAREALHLRAAPAPDMDDAEDEAALPRR